VERVGYLMSELFGQRTAGVQWSWEAGNWGECPPLETAIKKRLVKTVTDCVLQWFMKCVSYTLLVDTSSVSPIANPNPVYSHTQTYDNI
jgi:hypothetical protein